MVILVRRWIECIEVIRTAASSDQVDDSESLLKALVEETIVRNNNHSNGKSAEKLNAKIRRKANSKLADK